MQVSSFAHDRKNCQLSATLHEVQPGTHVGFGFAAVAALAFALSLSPCAFSLYFLGGSAFAASAAAAALSFNLGLKISMGGGGTAWSIISFSSSATVFDGMLHTCTPTSMHFTYLRAWWGALSQQAPTLWVAKQSDIFSPFSSSHRCVYELDATC